MPRWLEARDLVAPAAPPHASAPFVALVADLADPAGAWLDGLAPTQQDLSDRAGPIAGARTWFLRRRALLRHLVARQLGCAASDVVIAHDGAGAPQVLHPAGGVFVSVAAPGSFAACAVARAPVGIDLEGLGATLEPVALVLTPGERDALATLSPELASRRFLEIWTAKEAYLKASGLGLKRDPARVSVEVAGAAAFAIRDPQEKPVRWAGAFTTRRFGAQALLCACLMLAP